MRETLEQQDKAKSENEKREANLVLFRVSESKKQIPKERQQDDLSFFAEFCQKGLQCEKRH